MPVIRHYLIHIEAHIKHLYRFRQNCLEGRVVLRSIENNPLAVRSVYDVIKFISDIDT